MSGCEPLQICRSDYEPLQIRRSDSLSFAILALTADINGSFKRKRPFYFSRIYELPSLRMQGGFSLLSLVLLNFYY